MTASRPSFGVGGFQRRMGSALLRSGVLGQGLGDELLQAHVLVDADLPERLVDVGGKPGVDVPVPAARSGRGRLRRRGGRSRRLRPWRHQLGGGSAGGRRAVAADDALVGLRKGVGETAASAGHAACPFLARGTMQAAWSHANRARSSPAALPRGSYSAAHCPALKLLT